MEVQCISNKIYTELFKKQADKFSFFHSAPWFLGLSANPRILACYDQDKIIALWPFDIIKRLYVLKCLSHPTFVSNLGPIFFVEITDFKNKLSFERFQTKVVNHFLDYMDTMKVDCVAQDLLPSFELPHLMKFRKYQLTYKHSYFLPRTLSRDDIWSNMSKNHRYKINKMTSRYVVEESQDYDNFYDILKTTFNRIGISNLHNKDRLIGAIQTVTENKNGVLLCIKDKESIPLSYGFLGWDTKRMYYAIGANEVNKSEDTVSLYLLWKGIELSRKLGLDFDFEGTMIKGLDAHYSGFGSSRDVYVNIFRANKLFSKILFNLNALRGQ